MHKQLPLFLLSLLFSFFSVSAQPIYNLTSTLSGTNEVPPNASPGTGTLTGTYNQATKQITLNVPFSSLTGSTTASHIHAGPSGVNGGVIFPLTIPFGVTSGAIGGTYTLPPAQEAAFLAGNTYINIHTTAFPGGEIRGQITAIPAGAGPTAIPTLSEWGLIILALSLVAVGAWTLLRGTI